MRPIKRITFVHKSNKVLSIITATSGTDVYQSISYIVIESQCSRLQSLLLFSKMTLGHIFLCFFFHDLHVNKINMASHPALLVLIQVV